MAPSVSGDNLRRVGSTKPLSALGFHTLSNEPGRLTKVVLTQGKGEPPKNDGFTTVVVHYVGQLSSTGKVFDSSRKRGAPFAFSLGKQQVIEGWEKSLPTMLKGEKALVVCAPEFAYGDATVDEIPAGSTLEFEVELLDFYPTSQGPDNARNESEEKWAKEQQTRLGHVRGPRQGDDPTAGFDTAALVALGLILLWAAVHSNGLHLPYAPW